MELEKRVKPLLNDSFIWNLKLKTTQLWKILFQKKFQARKLFYWHVFHLTVKIQDFFIISL